MLALTHAILLAGSWGSTGCDRINAALGRESETTGASEAPPPAKVAPPSDQVAPPSDQVVPPQPPSPGTTPPATPTDVAAVADPLPVADPPPVAPPEAANVPFDHDAEWNALLTALHHEDAARFTDVKECISMGDGYYLSGDYSTASAYFARAARLSTQTIAPMRIASAQVELKDHARALVAIREGIARGGDSILQHVETSDHYAEVRKLPGWVSTVAATKAGTLKPAVVAPDPSLPTSNCPPDAEPSHWCNRDLLGEFGFAPIEFTVPIEPWFTVPPKPENHVWTTLAEAPAWKDLAKQLGFTTTSSEIPLAPPDFPLFVTTPWSEPDLLRRTSPKPPAGAFVWWPGLPNDAPIIVLSHARKERKVWAHALTLLSNTPEGWRAATLDVVSPNTGPAGGTAFNGSNVFVREDGLEVFTYTGDGDEEKPSAPLSTPYVCRIRVESSVLVRGCASLPYGQTAWEPVEP